MSSMTSLKFIGKRLLNSPLVGNSPLLGINIVSTRGFYAWLNSIFNRVDPNRIEEVDATDAAIMEVGFPHFKNCVHIRKIKLKNCGYIQDASMRSIAYLMHEHLSWLEVIQCHNISDEGLLALNKMKALKVLHLENLNSVKNPQEVIASLSESLPKCQITYPPFTTE